MTEHLAVWRGEDRVASLEWIGADATLTYDPAWLARPDAFPISVSLPLGPELLAGPAVAAFFANLLPEGAARAQVARRLGVSESNDAALLRALGGDCAGALAILPSDEVPDDTRSEHVALSEDDLRDLLTGDGALAVASGRAGVRLSLAGAQDKLPVLWRDGRPWLPRGTAASTHLLKLPSERFRNLPVVEAFTMRLGGALDLRTCNVELVTLGGRVVALVERFDRWITPDGGVVRLHQEDLCQALGLPPGRKYEAEGGPSFPDCARLVADVVREPVLDLRQLLRWQVFNVIAGNADGHAKNVSLLRDEQGLRLAPAYDLVCTRSWKSLDHRLAMGIGDCRDGAQVTTRCWRRLAADIGVGEGFLLGLVREMGERAGDAVAAVRLEHLATWGPSSALDGVARTVAVMTKRLLAELGTPGRPSRRRGPSRR